MSSCKTDKPMMATAKANVNIANGFDGSRIGEVLSIKGKNAKVRFMKPAKMIECPNCKCHKHVTRGTEGDMRYHCTNGPCLGLEIAKGELHPIVKVLPLHQLIIHEN